MIAAFKTTPQRAIHTHTLTRPSSPKKKPAAARVARTCVSRVHSVRAWKSHAEWRKREIRDFDVFQSSAPHSILLQWCSLSPRQPPTIGPILEVSTTHFYLVSSLNLTWQGGHSYELDQVKVLSISRGKAIIHSYFNPPKFLLSKFTYYKRLYFRPNCLLYGFWNETNSFFQFVKG